MFTKSSSSFHTINSDFQLSAVDKLLYFIFNTINFFWDFKHPKGSVSIEKFVFRKAKDQTFEDVGGTSVTRFLCNSFWNSIDYNYLKKTLGSELRVVDVGCGSGNYSNILKLTKIDTYLGVDIFPSPMWQQIEKSNVAFQVSSYLNVEKYLADRNLLITQSAIEHFEEDLSFFQGVQQFVQKSGQPLIQIHLFPAKAGLWTGLLHGIRQYNLRMICKILQVSKIEKPGLLILLGGKNSNRFHWNTVTKNLVLHRYNKVFTFANGYSNGLIKSIENDTLENNPRKTTFFALVLQHNVTTQLRYEGIINKTSDNRD